LKTKPKMKLNFAIFIVFVYYSAATPVDTFNDVKVLEGKILIGSFSKIIIVLQIKDNRHLFGMNV